MGRKVVVLGAAGYLGRHVTAMARDAGHDVTAVGRRPATDRFDPGITACNAADFEALLAVARGADIVVNTIAGHPRVMVAAANALRRLLQCDAVDRVVHISSLAVYGQDPPVLHEGIRPVPAVGHPYAHAKWRAELLLGDEARLQDRVLIIRPGCLYGPGAPVWVDRIARLLRARRLGWLGTRGNGQSNLIHVGDLARAIVNAAEWQVSGSYNLVPPEIVCWNDYFFELAALTDALPLREMGAAALAAETWVNGPARLMAAKLAGAEPDGVTPSMCRIFGRRGRIVSVQPAFMDVDSFRPLQEGLAEAAEAFLRQAAHGADAPARPVMLRRVAAS